jgi:hypothetical protein
VRTNDDHIESIKSLHDSLAGNKWLVTISLDPEAEEITVFSTDVEKAKESLPERWEGYPVFACKAIVR